MSYGLLDFSIIEGSVAEVLAAARGVSPISRVEKVREVDSSNRVERRKAPQGPTYIEVLENLYNDLGTMKWVGSPESTWDEAIEAVRVELFSKVNGY